MVRAAVTLLAAWLVPASIAAQAPLRQRPTRAFSRQVSVSFMLGFHGGRAELLDSASSGCEPELPCTRSYGPAGGAHVAVRYQEPLTRRLGLRLGADLSAPTLRIDKDGSEFARLNQRSTAIRGEAVLLFRFKPAVPIFFGAGGTYAWWNPGPVAIETGVTQSSGAEYGGILAIGYDAPIENGWGVRFEWTNYLMIPRDTELPATGFAVKSLTHDWTLGIGVTYQFGR